MTFMEQIERRRAELGLTVQAVADAVGRDHETVRKWLRGERWPDGDDLALLAHAVRLKAFKVPTPRKGGK